MNKRRRRPARPAAASKRGPAHHGRVIEMLGLEAVVTPAEQSERTLRARLKKAIANDPGVVVGDEVDYRLLEKSTSAEDAAQGPDAIIVGVRPRRSLLTRAGFQGRRRLIAANVDTVVIVVCPDNPPLRLGLIDRYLAACEQSEVRPVVCLNKADLDEDGSAYARLSVYRNLDIPTIRTSAPHGDPVSIDQLAEHLQGGCSALVGHSGVGKSSLAKALVPGLERAIGEVNETIGRGRHTTTTSTLIPLPFGGELVDTPGIRSFGLFGLDDASELATLYPDYQAHAISCRFRGCSHLHEPGCAVKTAVGAGHLDRDRYDRYVEIAESLSEPDS